MIRLQFRCLLAGLAFGLALPPMYQAWTPFIALPMVIWCLSKAASAKSAAVQGLCFGVGYFAVAFHWIGAAFLIDAETNLWMMPFAVGGLALLMACYWAVACLSAWALARRVMPLWLALPFTLAIVEWLRGHLFTGFPWAVPGQMLDVSPALLQTASLIGMPGLSFLVLLWAACGFVFFVWKNRARTEQATAIVLFALVPLLWVWGTHRLAQNPIPLDHAKTIRLVQPNIAQDDKWRGDNAAEIFETLLALSAAPAPKAPDLIIWPESALPFLLDEDDVARQRIGDTLSPGQTLLTGAIRRTRSAGGVEFYFTSVLMLDEEGNVISTYDKWRLVPGGEYLPFEAILAPLGFRKVVELPESFTAGSGPASLTIPGVGMATPLICYEVIFPHALLPPIRPTFIVNVTNDGWFGNSAGPYQHAAQVRLRAIEQGLPIVRAANTGISMVIDPLGRVANQTLLGEQTILDSHLPQPLALTVYARFGDFALFLILGATAALGLVVQRRRKTS